MRLPYQDNEPDISLVGRKKKQEKESFEVSVILIRRVLEKKDRQFGNGRDSNRNDRSICFFR